MKFNDKELKNFIDKMKISPKVIEQAIEKTVNDGALKLMEEVMLNTPVDTGQLRNAWKIQGATDNSLKVVKENNLYWLEVLNPKDYAEYVEYGHRQTPGRFVPAIGKRLIASFVEGKHMLENAEFILDNAKDKILKHNIETAINKHFDKE